MLYGQSLEVTSYKYLLAEPFWKKALDWVEHVRPDQADGEYEIDGRRMYALVQTVTCKPPTERTFESHRRHIDLQYCLQGGEIIEHSPVGLLNAHGNYNPDKDCQLYHPPEQPEQKTPLVMTPDRFAIFFQEDGHRPGIHDGVHPVTRKVVIKIHVANLFPQLDIRGPFAIKMTGEETATDLIDDGDYEFSNRVDISSENFDCDAYQGDLLVYLVCLGIKLNTPQAENELAILGYKPVGTLPYLAFGARFAHEAERQVSVALKDHWRGRERGKEYVCMHPDANGFRLRTHFDTVWGEHMYFACTKLPGF